MRAEISPGEKFAIIAFRTIRPAELLSKPLNLGAGTWAWGRPPFALGDWWQQSAGTVRENAFQQCNLFLMAKMASTALTNLDAENERLKKDVYWLFQALLLTGSIRVFETVFLTTGSFSADGPNTRQLAELPMPPLSTPGAPFDELTREVLGMAAGFVRSIQELEAMGGFVRVGRIYGIHQRALTNPDPVERLHQFCRCIEGFILPDIAQTTRQFRSRTELFVGPRHHVLMGRLYDMRSRAEHLRDIAPNDGLHSDRERRLGVLRECSFLEELSRCCIGRLLGTPELWPHFRDETSLANFWLPENAVLRQQTWGSPFDVTWLRDRFNEGHVSNGDLGL